LEDREGIFLKEKYLVVVKMGLWYNFNNSNYK